MRCSKCSGSCQKLLACETPNEQAPRHTNGVPGHGGAPHDPTPAAAARFHIQESGGSSTEGGTEAVAVGEAQEREAYTPRAPRSAHSIHVRVDI
jgi:hypothetical protein